MQTFLKSNSLKDDDIHELIFESEKKKEISLEK